MQEIIQFVSQHMILSLAWVGLFIAVLVTTFKSLFSRIKEISRIDAVQLINKEAACVVDVRSRDDFRKGHIAQAINLTPSDIKAGNLGVLAKKYTQPVIVVCATGMTSRPSAENLSRAGFEQVSILKEGIAGWQNDNLPLIKGK